MTRSQPDGGSAAGPQAAPEAQTPSRTGGGALHETVGVPPPHAVVAGSGGGADDGREAEVPDVRRWSGLSGKLLILTVLFVMLSEVLIFVPSMANFRNTWLNDKLTIAGVAASVLVETDMVSPAVQAELLRTTGAVAIALNDGDRRRLIAMAPVGVAGDDIRMTIDMGEADPVSSIMQSVRTLVAGGGGFLRVVGPSQMGLGGRVDVVLPQSMLRDAMLGFAVRILALSLVISAITAALVYLSLRWMFVRPIRRLTGSMARFQAAPDDPARIIVPSGRNDELGDAEQRLAGMQAKLAETLEQRRQLAKPRSRGVQDQPRPAQPARLRTALFRAP